MTRRENIRIWTYLTIRGGAIVALVWLLLEIAGVA